MESTATDGAVVRSDFISLEICAYIASHTKPPDALRQQLRDETEEKVDPEHSGMQIGDDQFAFMEIFIRSIGAKRGIEIGTFTGASSIALARGMGPEGRLLCCDISDEWTSIARKYWDLMGLSDRIELRIAPATQTLEELPDDVVFDFAFIDADKPAYLDYYEAVLPRIRPGGLILIDNTLYHGWLVDESNHQLSADYMRKFNDHVAADDRVKTAILTIGDGITVAEKKG